MESERTESELTEQRPLSDIELRCREQLGDHEGLWAKYEELRSFAETPDWNGDARRLLSIIHFGREVDAADSELEVLAALQFEANRRETRLLKPAEPGSNTQEVDLMKVAIDDLFNQLRPEQIINHANLLIGRYEREHGGRPFVEILRDSLSERLENAATQLLSCQQRSDAIAWRLRAMEADVVTVGSVEISRFWGEQAARLTDINNGVQALIRENQETLQAVVQQLRDNVPDELVRSVFRQISPSVDQLVISSGVEADQNLSSMETSLDEMAAQISQKRLSGEN